MRNYTAFTSLLRNVRTSKGEGYEATHIARPEPRFDGSTFLIGGKEKRIKLPDDGYFTISHILETDDGLPHETTPKRPNEAYAHWKIEEGAERPVIRGHRLTKGARQFDATAHWESSSSFPSTGIRAAMQYQKPSAADFARFRALAETYRRENECWVEPSVVIRALSAQSGIDI